MDKQLFELGETKEEYIKKMAAKAQTSENAIRQALRIKELEEAGELAKGTTQDIMAGKTTASTAFWQRNSPCGDLKTISRHQMVF